MPVANAYLPQHADFANEPRYPLRAVVCQVCRLVQLDTIVDEVNIFSEYAYFSSASDTWLTHARKFCEAITKRLQLTNQSLVVEIASNDGYLLRNFVEAEIPCFGVDPAANVARVACESGVPTEVMFFGLDAAKFLVSKSGRHADLVVANNVLAHVPNLNDFVAGLAHLVGANGVVSLEVPHLGALVSGVQFDTIYHEHYAYWSLMAMERLFARHGLSVLDVEHLRTHGGSIRVQAKAHPISSVSAELLALRAAEQSVGMDFDSYYQGFDSRVNSVLSEFRSWLLDNRAKGKRVAAYGAAAKGNTFLNASHVGVSDIFAVADRSAAKQGRYLPGSHLAVVSPTVLLQMEPDVILILPWNIRGEIVELLRGAGYRGELVTAVPRVEYH
jgi:SAM-dependent methyltransferase